MTRGISEAPWAWTCPNHRFKHQNIAAKLGVGQTVCTCLAPQYASKIIDALEKSSKPLRHVGLCYLVCVKKWKWKHESCKAQRELGAPTTTMHNKKWHIQLSTPLLGSKLEAFALPPSYILEQQARPCDTTRLLQDLQVRLRLCLPCTGTGNREGEVTAEHAEHFVRLTGSHRCVQLFHYMYRMRGIWRYGTSNLSRLLPTTKLLQPPITHCGISFFKCPFLILFDTAANFTQSRIRITSIHQCEVVRRRMSRILLGLSRNWRNANTAFRRHFKMTFWNQLEVVRCHGPALILLLDVNGKRCGEVSEFSVVERSSEAWGFHGHRWTCLSASIVGTHAVVFKCTRRSKVKQSGET